ncbi:MAG: ABC transporter [Gammaproteobacteria bacterium HGW-Gammaproteobacteria-3]|nr:MAG: ABC transporter [Gammaproteobacteria bacterium HGW-Gammaproteobacteria-3]
MTALSIQKLTKIYSNGFRALNSIDLAVETGDFFALLGPNGAGKSTTIGIISSLINASGGVVEIFGHDLHNDRERAKNCIGLVPQEINFNQFETVRSIVMIQAGYYGIKRKEALVRSEKCLRQMDLWDRRDTVSRRLSGGMKRRLMIARAMVHSPRLLILDEPTAGVDIEIRRSMWDLMREVNRQGTTIILTTHYLEEAESLCRNIAIINHGRIVEHSDMASLLARLHVNHFVLDLAAPVTAVPVIPGYQIDQLSARSLSVAVPQQQGLNKLFAQLSEQNIQVVSMKNKANRLEQLFMDLIGQNQPPL